MCCKEEKSNRCGNCEEMSEALYHTEKSLREKKKEVDQLTYIVGMLLLVVAKDDEGIVRFSGLMAPKEDDHSPQDEVYFPF